ncbi:MULTISPECIES: glucose-1-phosphatase [Photorhabdus]|uniref:Glucose-1-phosphatase n=1 Tax=Photorhabdus kayaii TaxID=230088 RepID=A0ABX0B1X4_9GAMM|nr:MULTISPECIES: glucose-1-phosphatase [Photorhabdus]MCC8375389.1 glucose-1-phosphatase [Photorhabdus bodei]MCC8464625.1 glucose-1-phosphatase [Photorhabdus bodei]MCT8352127.1 glucose-1-phosphatase [Photorhabdus kayaii]MDB6367954.1 glucose-1-phosphatase [Photorhabdus bodei]NDL11023.1 glucose-1-phosphatase [Photorhabdus kayaii]
MLYIFDMGNVIIEIDFKRVLAVWSNLSGTPLATLTKSFSMGETFEKHERGQITDLEFADTLCQEMNISLSFEQFAAGWHAIFINIRPEVIQIMKKLREAGHRVVVLSNTNRLHLDYWPHNYPEIAASADYLYLSQDLAMRKPEPDIFKYVLETEGFSPDQAVFFDDVLENVEAARALGINSIHVVDRQTVPDYFEAIGFSEQNEGLNG